MTVRWLGQAGFALSGGGQCIVVDPWLADHPRRAHPAPTLEDLPGRVDWLLATHEHADHLDIASLPALLERYPGVEVVVPAPLRDRVAAVSGRARLRGVQPGDRLPLGDVTVHVVHAWHGVDVSDGYSDGHGLGTDGRTPFVGFVIEFPGLTLYHAGDTIADPALVKEILPLRVDVALLPVNSRDAAREAAGSSGTSTRAAVAFATDIAARVLVPMHWRIIRGNRVRVGRTVEAARAARRPLSVLVPAFGADIRIGLPRSAGEVPQWRSERATMAPETGGARTGWTWDDALCGVVPPLISPFRDPGELDPTAFARVVEHVLAGGCSGLFVLGGCGEGAWLTGAQRAAVVRAAVAAAAGRVPVLVGVMLPASGPTCEAARQAAAEGADAVVVGSPYYMEVDAGGHERHIEAVLGAVQVPVLLYNIPQATHSALSPETVARLSAEARILGIKDSAGDLGGFQRFLAVKRSRAGFRVLQGDELCASAGLLLGCDGLVPGMANFVPSLYVELRSAAAAGDAARCTRLQAVITDLWALHAQGHWLSGLKAACAMLGLGDGVPSAPLLPATDDQRRAIRAILVRNAILPTSPGA